MDIHGVPPVNAIFSIWRRKIESWKWWSNLKMNHHEIGTPSDEMSN